MKSCVLYSKTQKVFFLISLLFSFLLSTSNAGTDHTNLITTYEGSKTCRTCHEDVMEDVIGSIHYKLMGQTQDVYNMFTNKPVVGIHGKGNRY